MTGSSLEEVLPRYDVHEVHERVIAAPPAEVWSALRSVTGDEIRLLRPLMAIRTLPAHLRRSGPELRSSGPVLDEFLRHGFLKLAERPGEEIVVGAVGRFWSVMGNMPVSLSGPDGFRAFDAPGYAKAATSFELSPAGAGTRVRTETRVVGTDAASSRRFRAYWLLIRPGSGVIRHSWLAAIERRAR